MSKKIKKSANDHTGEVVWQWAEKKTVTTKDFAAIEQLWGVSLPSDYVQCARDNHGGHPTPECFDIKDRKEIVLNRLLAYHGKSNLIEKTWILTKDRLPPRVFPLANDVFGNLICFAYEAPRPTIVFWNHEIKDVSKSTTMVCRSFTELLTKLYTPE